MTYHTGLLNDRATAIQDQKVWNCLDSITSGQLRMALGVYLKNDGMPRHIGRRACDFGGGHLARLAPLRPKVDQHRHPGFARNFIEQRGISL